MSLKDWFTQWEVSPALLTIATNGLDSNKDRILAYDVGFPDEDKKELRLIQTSGDELLKAQSIHQISSSDMSFLGRSMEEQKKYLEEVFDKYTVFVYNVPFYYDFVSAFLEDKRIFLYDLSIVEQAVRKEHRFYEDDCVNFKAWYSAASNAFDPMPVRSICRLVGLTRQPSPGQLPLERMLEILTSLYTSSSSKEILLSTD